MLGQMDDGIIDIEFIKGRRRIMKIPQWKVSSLLGISQSAISQIENGKRELKFSEAVKLAKILNVGVMDFVKPEFRYYLTK